MNSNASPSRSTEETCRIFRSREGLQLAAGAWGNANNPPVLLLHGGGQTRHAWGGTAAQLAERGFYAVTLDARGHGDSDWSGADGYKLEHFADDLEDIREQLGTAPAVVGASLGGMTGMLAIARNAGRRPAFARSLVLVDITHRSQPDGVQRILDFMRAAPEGFASVEEAAEAVARFLPHRPRPSDTSGLAKNLRRGEDGRYRWHWDPSFLGSDNRPDPAKAAERLADAARRLDVPTLLVRGGISDIVGEDSVREFLELVPHARYVDVAGAAHMVAGDRNDAFSRCVVEFLEEQVSR